MDVVAALDIKTATLGTFQTLVAGNQLVEAMVKTPFTPALGLVPGDVTIADFTGYASLVSTGTAIDSCRNSLRQGRDVTIRGAASDWVKKASDLVNLPQSIFGLIVSDGVTSQIYGSRLFDEPLPITAVAEGAVFDLEIFFVGDAFIK